MSQRHAFRVVSSQVGYHGRVISVRRDEVLMPGGTTSIRDVVVHPGAVGVVALDETGAVVLVEQYRHPVHRRLWELPAGLLDIEGEPAWQAAARELVEETGLEAGQWDVLADTLTSPGMTDEATRIFLARDLRPVARPAGEHEEAELLIKRVPLADAVSRVLAGELENAMACVGLLAADRAVRTAYRGLRPRDAPWPARPS